MKIDKGLVAAVFIAAFGVIGGPSFAAEEQLHVIGVFGPLSDPFFSATKKGGDDAAAGLGVNFEFTAPNDLSNISHDLVRLIEVGASRKPDAMIIGDYITDAQDPAIKAAVDAGIPVIIVGDGLDSWEKVGALAFIGFDGALAGREAGRQMLAAGVKHALCVVHVPGNPAVAARCKSFDEVLTAAGAKVTTFNIPVTDAGNPQQVTQAIKGNLAADPSIDAIFTLGSGIAENALQAVDTAGLTGKIKVGTTDISTNLLNAVKAGTLLFDLDQQPYLESYLALVSVVLYVKYGLHPIGVVNTGPLVITKDNVDAVLEAQKLGVRGAG